LASSVLNLKRRREEHSWPRRLFTSRTEEVKRAPLYSSILLRTGGGQESSSFFSSFLKDGTRPRELLSSLSSLLKDETRPRELFPSPLSS